MSRDSDWGRSLGNRILAFIRDERPGTLMEFPLSQDDESRLGSFVRTLPIESGVQPSEEACIALHAVIVAARADVSQDSFREEFFKSIGRSMEIGLWESHYGSAIERFLRRAFSQEPTPGPYRYVGAVYRYTGVTGKGIRAFAGFLSRVLKQSPMVLRSVYDAQLEGQIGRAHV